MAQFTSDATVMFFRRQITQARIAIKDIAD